MSTDEKPLYGPKVDRLLHIQTLDSLGHLVPPIFAIAPLWTAVPNHIAQADELVFFYASALAQALPQLISDVQEVCGPPPWIVRSAGHEDLTDHINAGGYESLICAEPHALIPCVAAVAMSGSSTQARQQLALSQHEAPAGAIACFVQPLLKLDVCADVGHDHSPYLDPAVLEHMETVCQELMQRFDFIAIDCEWGLETTLGLVSVTTVMPRDPQRMNMAHTLGFGFASAQSSGSRATTLALRPAGSTLRLWRARHLRATTVQRLHLLQARPAYMEDAFRERDGLSSACREALIGGYDVLPASLLMLGAQSSGRALVAPDLMSAWRWYLALSAQAQADVAVVIVDEGNAQEHAGIMFCQQRMTCLRMTTRRIPAGADYVVFDRGTCLFGGATMLRGLERERHRELVLPDGCALIFSGDVVGRDGTLRPDCVKALSQLRRLPVAPEVQDRLFADSEQPMPGRWMQGVDGTVVSPSLLAAIWRSTSSADGGARHDLSDFSKQYQRAVQLSQQTSEPELTLPTLCALSPLTHSLLVSGDLRIVMALLDCEAATVWVTPQTLQRLLNSAAAHWAVPRGDDAVLVLDSVSFIRTECARLPVYELDDAASYLEALAHDLQAGLPVETIRSIHSLALPIDSAVRLMHLALDNPSLVDAVEGLRQSLALFRSQVANDDSTTCPAQPLNDEFVRLRSTLIEVGLEGVVEQIRGSLIETYDASLKGLLVRTVEAGDASGYRRYLSVMQGWIGCLRIGSLPERDAAVLHCFETWLQAWMDEVIPVSFQIQDRHWQFEFDAIALSCVTPPRYENPHVLHNLLHQYALAGLRFDTQGLPRRVQALEHLCSTFSCRSTKVLRFERELLEIQIPMGTHKASYVFTPHQILVEWTEPPDCPEGEIARVLVFEACLEHFRTWMFPGLVTRREQVLGTWTLFIRLNAQGGGPWDYAFLQHFVVATRLLFDASYDFSYVANKAVATFVERVAGRQWRRVFTTLIQHRAVLEDTSQYVALHALPMSSTVGAIACNRVVRGLLLRCQRRGGDYCRGLIEHYAFWLNDEAADDRRWAERYELLRQGCLFLAATWPILALSQLTERNVFHIGDDLIAASLFKRSDLVDDLRHVMTISASTLSGIPGMVVRHAPHLAVEARGAASLAERLVGTGPRFCRAKQFLVARYGDRLDQHLLAGLLQELVTVPWGDNACIEQAIQAQLRHGPVYRFELNKGIDWTTLDSWLTLEQRSPAYLMSPLVGPAGS